MKHAILSVLAIIYFFTSYAQKIYKKGIVYSFIEVKMGTNTGTTLSETETKTILQDDKLKVISKSVVSESISFIDRMENKATNLSTVLGEKLGFTMTLPKKGSNDKIALTQIDSTKIINGISCKKAILSSILDIERKFNTTVWYASDIKFTDSTMGINIQGIEKIPGVPIQIKALTPQGYYVIYSVSKIDLTSQIDESEFTVPKGYIIYPNVQEYQKKIRELSSGGN